MPEGHTLRRLADDLAAAFGGRSVRVSSPQGRFDAEAALLDRSELVGADSAGKHLFVQFEGDRVVQVHLGLIGTCTGRRRSSAAASTRSERGAPCDAASSGRCGTRPEHTPEAMGRPARRDDHGGEVYVYRRQGQPCLVCGSGVRTRELAGRNAFWCPRCQPTFRSRARRTHRTGEE
jgi:formamidopyrimidine-DNA glycosylase